MNNDVTFNALKNIKINMRYKSQQVLVFPYPLHILKGKKVTIGNRYLILNPGILKSSYQFEFKLRFRNFVRYKLHIVATITGDNSDLYWQEYLF